MRNHRNDIYSHQIAFIRYLFGLLLFFTTNLTIAQDQVLIKGSIQNQQGEGIPDVSINIQGTTKGTTSKENGDFEFRTGKTDSITLVFRHVQYQLQNLSISPSAYEILQIILEPSVTVLDQVEVTGDQDEAVRTQAGSINIEAKSAKELPSAFGDFSRVLATLPGVVSNNELSSSYAVRGGNFDENLVYVNDILVYRPFLIRAGQQEGLSFINPDLVQGINFSAGGWQPKYGDKLSSNLNIQYKQPEAFQGSGTISTLGGRAHVEGVNKSGNVSTIFGVRHKNARYLFNTLDIDGQYLPRFTDVQSFTTFNLQGDPFSSSQTDINLLLTYSQNRYFIEPEARETDFGTFNRSFRLFVAFDGREVSEYDTYQGAVKLNHRFNDKIKSSLILSTVSTKERELFEVEGGYRLCDLNTDPSSANFNECAVIRGVGTDFSFGRNTLDARIINLDNRSTWFVNDRNRIEFGVGFANENIEDQLDEFSFTDSANFSTITERFFNEIDLNSNRLTAYAQHTVAIKDSVHFITYGVRLNYWDLNNETLLSPRIQYAWQPGFAKNTVFRISGGRYVQPPFYRELRDRVGQINLDLRAQTSWHIIGGIDHIINMWGRNFTVLAEAYYKTLNNVVAYDIDDVRIRYFGNNLTSAYASGFDFRINGEFIPGAESWFSVGILKTEEDIPTDSRGNVRRPSDQRVNLGIFFQDHLPNDPSYRVLLSFLYGSGLPFGPPRNDDFRNFFDGDQYLRADLGLTKVFDFRRGRIKSLQVGLDILNLFGINNTISYLWVSDLNNDQFAVPNDLSARFFNAKVTVNF